MDDKSGSGQLVLAATPLGDLRDASPRLAELLATAEVIAAEDTRRARSLATSLGIKPTGQMVSCYDAVEAARLPGLLAAIRAGSTVLLVTDAGMPSVSDPGYRLVAACVAENLSVTCVPGPSAVTTALAVSGLPSDRFCFEGFPPRKSAQRKRWLAEFTTEPRTCIFFESPRRLAATLAEAVDVLGAGRQAAVCRELTKTHEEVRRGNLAELAEWAAGGVLGEVTVVLAGADPMPAADPAELVSEVEKLVAAGERLKDAVSMIATSANSSKQILYNAVLAARADSTSSNSG